MDNISINLSLSNIWKSWFLFKRGKKSTLELKKFTYFLEQNLFQLYHKLNNSSYGHGGYKKFIATDNKRREISVASIKDRIVHRLVYEYLIEIYDKTFIFDVWSCRKKKGLFGAIKRAQKFLTKYPKFFVWRADVKKFFDNVDQRTLLEMLFFRVKDARALNILNEIILSYRVFERERERVKMFRGKGIPIGNLTSQIFANIYLNDLDRFVKHRIKPTAYLRYGDDFIVILKNSEQLKKNRNRIILFLKEKLLLDINTKNDIIVKIKQGLKFLGVKIFPKGRKLNKRNWNRARAKLNIRNISSYSGLVKQHSKEKIIKEFNWTILEKIN